MYIGVVANDTIIFEIKATRLSQLLKEIKILIWYSRYNVFGILKCLIFVQGNALCNIVSYIIPLLSKIRVLN